MIIHTDLFPEPISMFGLTLTPRELSDREINMANIYWQQWRELLFVGYVVVWLLHYVWVFLNTLDDRLAARCNPFEIERWYVSSRGAKRKPFGWKRFLS